MRRLLTQRRALAMVVLGLCLTSLLPSAASSLLTGPPRWLVHTLTGWLTQPLSQFAGTLRSRPSLDLDRGDPRYLQQNYDALLKYNAFLRDENQRLSEELSRYRWARENLKFQTRVDFVFADVTAISAGKLRRTLSLNRGTSGGLRVNQVVVDWYNFSLVGRITDAGPRSATVELITSQNSRPMVKFLPSGPVRPPASPTMLQLTPQSDGRSLWATIKTDTPVNVGDLAHLADPGWPPEARGFVVGKVSLLQPQPDNPYLYNKVVVEPIHDANRLSRVIVLVNSEDDMAGR